MQPHPQNPNRTIGSSSELRRLKQAARDLGLSEYVIESAVEEAGAGALDKPGASETNPVDAKSLTEMPAAGSGIWVEFPNGQVKQY